MVSSGHIDLRSSMFIGMKNGMKDNYVIYRYTLRYDSLILMVEPLLIFR